MRILGGKRGFTLIELMMVVVVLGIITAIIIPRVSSTKSNAETKACKSNQANLNAGLERYKAEKGSYPDKDDYAALKADTTFKGIYVNDVPDCPSGGTTMSYAKATGTVSCSAH